MASTGGSPRPTTSKHTLHEGDIFWYARRGPGKAQYTRASGTSDPSKDQDQDHRQSLVTMVILYQGQVMVQPAVLPLAHNKEEKMLKPVQVVIGRGRGGSRPPLNAAAWGRFQSKISHFMAVRGEFYRSVEGLGVDENGVPEQNATLLGAVAEDDLAQFRLFLDNLRIEFEQTVILLIVGELDVIV